MKLQQLAKQVEKKADGLAPVDVPLYEREGVPVLDENGKQVAFVIHPFGLNCDNSQKMLGDRDSSDDLPRERNAALLASAIIDWKNIEGEFDREAVENFLSGEKAFYVRSQMDNAIIKLTNKLSPKHKK